MIRFAGARADVEMLASHVRICDLLQFEFPVLSLFSDGRRNWLYLWCDTDNVDTNRWLLAQTTRPQLVKYLAQESPLRPLFEEARQVFVLDESTRTVHGGEARPSHRLLRRPQSLDDIQAYLPDHQAMFTRELAPDIEVGLELVPSTFEVPIGDTWFAVDFNEFFKCYARMYAFLYATRPRFVRSIRSRLEELLRAPWRGGYSRVNLFGHLPKYVPALHGLRVPGMVFNSPGAIRFEALKSVGEAVRSATLRYVDAKSSVEGSAAEIRSILGANRLNKADLSEVTDEAALLGPIDKQQLEGAAASIGVCLGLNAEFETLRSCSPNLVVYVKAVLGFMTQLRRLARFQDEQMLDYRRGEAP